MKTENLFAGCRKTVLFAAISAGLLLATAPENAEAGLLNSCTTYCHGMPPKDGIRKGNPHFDSQSSSFTGNHVSHLPAAPAAVDCSVCHLPVSPTDYGHQSGVINMRNSLKGYSSASIRAKYDKGLFFNQTSIPNLASATCSNASCHFETKTPVWGTAPSAIGCTSCHSAPPTGAGSHSRHDAYFTGASGCQKCHPAYTTFSHASSAGRPLRIQLRDPQNSLEASGVYSGSGTNYFPSQSGTRPAFGNCSNLYCHSSGQSTTGSGAGTTVTTGSWGSGALNCGSCHKDMATDAAATGKHIKHAQTSAIACGVCHGAVYSSTTVPTGAGTTHVDRNINLAWTGIAASPATTYSKGNSFGAGSAVYGTCSNSYCHSTVQNAANGANTSVTYQSGFSWASVSTLGCGSCHVDMSSDPTGTGSHRVHTISTGLNADCTICHQGYTKSTSNPATHVNGLIDLGAAGISYSQGSGTGHTAGNGYGSCSTTVCHGSGAPTWGATAAAPVNGFPYSANQCEKCHGSTATNPFYSTAIPKNTANTDPKVGAHTAHITASERLHPGLLCVDCHGNVSLNDATHMNGTTNFNWSALATTGGLTPLYNPSTGQCSNVYCHGGHMPGGDTSGSNRTPIWSQANYLPSTISAAACGTCHGFPPPVSAGHPAVDPAIIAGFPTTPLGTSCNCHPSVNQTIGIGLTTYQNVFSDPALHINGKLDGGECNSCHGYPPISRSFIGSAGILNNWTGARFEDYSGGGGAHTINSHVRKTARPADGFAYCSNCHNPADHMTQPNSFTVTQHIKTSVNNRVRYEAGRQPRYTSNRLVGPGHVTGTCSNISCHFGATPKWDPNH